MDVRSTSTDVGRLRPTFWFLAFPAGGCLVVPDCVLPAHWKVIRLNGRGCWLWRYWQRFDCVATWPELPSHYWPVVTLGLAVVFNLAVAAALGCQLKIELEPRRRRAA